MKKIIIFALLIGLIAPVGVFAQATSAVSVKPVSQVITQAQAFTRDLHRGQQSDEIRDLQEILKSDPSIYPEGLVTGYYGKLTESAIKKLQGRYGLPETGTLDDATRKIIYPTNIEIKVVAPNGGEVWDKSELHTILWKSSIGPIVIRGREVVPSASNVTGSIRPEIYPFFPRASIDLIKDSNPHFRYHIATVNLLDSQYSWKIPARILEGKDYRVRISVGKHVPCLYRLQDAANANELSIIAPPCLLQALNSGSDASDGVFAITGRDVPSDDVVKKLKQQIREMRAMISRLLQQLSAMEQLLNSL